METLDFLGRIALGTGLAAVLGLEREVTGKAAGLRTHSMVGLGAALFTLLSIEGFDAPDPSRVAAQIVSGIGFLGAGAIFRSGALIQGLTTAAGLWAAAAVGMAAGSGEYQLALLATGVGMMVLLGLRYVNDWISRFRTGVPLEVEIAPASAFLRVRDDLTSIDPAVDLEGVRLDSEGSITLRFIVGPDKLHMLSNALRAMEHVAAVRVPE